MLLKLMSSIKIRSISLILSIKPCLHEKELLTDTLDHLAAYTMYHFSTEEKYMCQYNYIDPASHKREHDTFVTKIDSLITDFRSNKLGLPIEIVSFLRDWVSTHIRGTDKKYS